MSKGYIAGGPLERLSGKLTKDDMTGQDVLVVLEALDQYYRERIDTVQVRVSELSDNIIKLKGNT